MKHLLTALLFAAFTFQQMAPVQAQEQPAIPAAPSKYTVGSDDILLISVLRPDEFVLEVTVTQDGYISFPYLGSVLVRDKTLDEIQHAIEQGLSDGYLRYPVVSVTMKESRSRRFFVYGEVTTPGAYPLDQNMTVFKALSLAGGFTKFGSSSKVKILRPKKDGPGYDLIKIDVKEIMNGSTNADALLTNGDVVVVSEGVF